MYKLQNELASAVFCVDLNARHTLSRTHLVGSETSLRCTPGSPEEGRWSIDAKTLARLMTTVTMAGIRETMANGWFAKCWARRY